MVECHLNLRKTSQDSIKIIVPGIFFGSALFAGRGIWTEDILVTEMEELENSDASESHVRRLNAEETRFWRLLDLNPTITEIRSILAPIFL